MRRRFLNSVLSVALALANALLAGCTSGGPKPPVTAERVDVNRYLGRWYEIARLPMLFQKTGEPAMAEYGLNKDGTLSVHNVAIRPDGSNHGVYGYARVLNPPQNTKLAVRFNTWFGPLIPLPEEGNYWILYVDEGYRRAIVGSPSRRYLWFLSRDPKISDQELQDLKFRAANMGFDLNGLILDPRS